MGTILSTKVRDDKKIVFEIVLDQEEAMHLKGHLDNIHIFSENAVEIETLLVQRGKRGATKYFLVPRTLRDNLKSKEKISCQRIETKSRIMFIYVVDKIGI